MDHGVPTRTHQGKRIRADGRGLPRGRSRRRGLRARRIPVLHGSARSLMATEKPQRRIVFVNFVAQSTVSPASIADAPPRTSGDAPRCKALIAEAVMCLGQKPWNPRGCLMDPRRLAVPADTSRCPLNGFSLAT